MKKTRAQSKFDLGATFRFFGTAQTRVHGVCFLKPMVNLVEKVHNKHARTHFQRQHDTQNKAEKNSRPEKFDLCATFRFFGTAQTRVRGVDYLKPMVNLIEKGHNKHARTHFQRQHDTQSEKQGQKNSRQEKFDLRDFSIFRNRANARARRWVFEINGQTS